MKRSKQREKSNIKLGNEALYHELRLEKKPSYTKLEPKIFATGIYDSNKSASKGFSSKVSSFIVNLKDSESKRLSGKVWVGANGKKMQGEGEGGKKNNGGREGSFFLLSMFPSGNMASVGI